MKNILNYKELYKNEISGAFLFYGHEKLLMDNTLKYVVNKYISKDTATFNLSIFDGINLSVDKVISSIETLPLLSDKRIIVIKNASEFSENIDKDFLKKLEKLENYVIIIFLDYSNEINKTKSFYKFFQKNNKNVEFPKLKGREIYNFIDQYFIRNGIKIKPNDLSYLVSKSGYDSKNMDLGLYDIKNELDKIISLVEDGILTKEIIDSSLVDRTDSNIFNFIEAICSKNSEKAILELNNLHELNEPIQKVFYMIIRQVHLMIGYVSAKKLSVSDREIQAQLKVKDYEFSKLKNYCRNFTLDELSNIHTELLEIDSLIKTSSISERLLVEMLIIKLSIQN